MGKHTYIATFRKHLHRSSIQMPHNMSFKSHSGSSEVEVVYGFVWLVGNGCVDFLFYHVVCAVVWIVK